MGMGDLWPLDLLKFEIVKWLIGWMETLHKWAWKSRGELEKKKDLPDKAAVGCQEYLLKLRMLSESVLQSAWVRLGPSWEEGWCP
jgi:hypothetical protein